MPDSDYDRLLQTSLREAEREIVALVEREFENWPPAASIETQTLPWIGGWPYIGTRAEHEALVVRALLARRWFEFEAPPWALPLPLTVEDCIALFNGPNQHNRRCRLVGEYGQHLRGYGWHHERATPFEVFVAQALAPEPEKPRRKVKPGFRW